MSDIYHQHPHIERMSIRSRSKAFRDTVLDILTTGRYTASELEAIMSELEADEAYEVAQGIVDGISDFKRNPQLSIG